jgi:hypothetical protein
MHLTELIPILQVAIAPVILISGVGLLLLSMTNRLGRVIDRSRLLAGELRKAGEEERPRLVSQLKILARRARLVQLAIILAGGSVLLAAIMIIVIFAAAVFAMELGYIVVILFTGCMAALIGAMIVFLADVNLALVALRLEIEGK